MIMEDCKRKRILAVLIALAMVLTMFTGNTMVYADEQLVSGTAKPAKGTVYEAEPAQINVSVTAKAEQGIEVPTDIVLVMDCSGSMTSDNRFSAMQQAGKNFLNIVNFNQHQVGIVGYESSPKSTPLTDNKDTLNTFLDGLTAGGTTATHLAINQAVDVLNGGRSDARKAIVLLTDGKADSDAETYSAAENAKNKGIVFYTIAVLGPNEDPDQSAPNAELKRIATSATHHHFVLGSVGLDAVYKEVAGQIGAANPTDVVITQTITDDFDIVAGSTDSNIPRPTVNGNTITWTMNEVQAQTFNLSYKVVAKAGLSHEKHAVTTGGTITYKTYDGQERTNTIAPTYVTIQDYPTLQLEKLSANSTKVNTSKDILIYGSGFLYGDNFKVYVGNEEASVLAEANSFVKVKVPAIATAGTYDVTVVNNYTGEQKTLSQVFTYTEDNTEVKPFTLDRLSSPSGKVNTTKDILVYGTGFKSGNDFKVTVGGEEAAVLAVANSFVKITVPAIATAGTYDVTVTNGDGQTATLAQAYTYEEEPVTPLTLTKLSSPSGKVNATKDILVYGSGFKNGNGFKVTVGGEEATVVTVAGSFVKITVPAIATAGTYDVEVTNGDGQTASLTQAYTYIEDNTETTPLTLTKLSSPSGKVNATKDILVYGSGFKNGNGFKVTVGGEEATVVTVASSFVKITVPAIATAGTYDVEVTNGDGQTATLAQSYTYEGEPVIPLTLTKLSSPSGKVNKTKDILVYGAGFKSGNDFKVTVGGEEAAVVTVANSFVKITVPAITTAGTYDVTVTNGDGQTATLAQSYTYEGDTTPVVPLTLDRLSSPSGKVNTTKDILVYGTGFKAGNDFKVTVGGEEAAIVTVANSFVKITVPAIATAGTYDVTVTNGDGQTATLTQSYTYEGETVVQLTLKNLSSPSGKVNVTKDVLVYGSGFKSGNDFKVTVGGEEAVVLAVANSFVKITVPAIATAGTYDVTVTNGDGQTATLAQSYTYEAEPIVPITLTKASTYVGTAGKTKDILIYGTGFKKQKQLQVLVGGEPAVVKATANSFVKVTIPAIAAKGDYEITVTGDDGLTVALGKKFTYK